MDYKSILEDRVKIILASKGNLKHFLKERMGKGKYSVRVSEVRNSVIDILLNNKK